MSFFPIDKKGDHKSYKRNICQHGGRFSNRIHNLFRINCLLANIPYGFPFKFAPKNAVFLEVEIISVSENFHFKSGLKRVISAFSPSSIVEVGMLKMLLSPVSTFTDSSTSKSLLSAPKHPSRPILPK